VPALKVLNQWLRGCETNQVVRVEFASDSSLWRTSLDIPGGWGIDRGYREFSLLQSFDDSWKRLTDLPGKAEALFG
jgi:uncharacterized protein YbdZ (MbtH family)